MVTVVSLSMPLSDPWLGFQASRGFNCRTQLGFLVLPVIDHVANYNTLPAPEGTLSRRALGCIGTVRYTSLIVIGPYRTMKAGYSFVAYACKISETLKRLKVFASWIEERNITARLLQRFLYSPTCKPNFTRQRHAWAMINSMKRLLT